MSSPKIYIAGMLMLFLCGCSLFHPYIDRRRNPGVSDVSKLYSGPSKPNMPVICYNPLLTEDDELQQMADAECVKNETGKKAYFVKKNYFNGKLLLPSHAYYLCLKDGEETRTEAQIEQYRENTQKNIIEEDTENKKLDEEEEDDEFTVGK